MELSYYGANCLKITTKKAQIIVDDNLSELGLKSITRPSDISLRTFAGIPSAPSVFEASTPGEYEIADVVIHGIAARANMDDKDKNSATIFTILSGDFKVAIVGHIFPELSEEQLEAIGVVDVMVVPVGNSGYTMDGAGALQLVKQIEPKTVVPTHYADKALKYEVPQVDLAEALKSMGMEPAETVENLKSKTGEFSETTRLVVLQRQ